MPKPSLLPPEPESRKPLKKIAPTPAQIARIVTAKLASPVGMPDKAELALKLVLPRAVIERLMVRARAEGAPSLAAWVQEVLVREGSPRRRGAAAQEGDGGIEQRTARGAAALARHPEHRNLRVPPVVTARVGACPRSRCGPVLPNRLRLSIVQALPLPDP